ncbi:MAG: hypothetical protein V4568_06665 [Pseudomonadota bacterium]
MKNSQSNWALVSTYLPKTSMLRLDDPRWEMMTAGHQKFYDPRSAFASLERNENTAAVWSELWDELHHQGVVGEASYAAIPHLVRIVESQAAINWNLFGIVCTVEVERHRRTNPRIPSWLQESYTEAWKVLSRLARSAFEQQLEPWQVRVLLGILALANSDLKLGALLVHSAAFEVDSLVEEHFAWSKLYASSINSKAV